jgi:hypothetical protein
MTYQTVSNWLITNFGENNISVLAIPFTIFILLSIIGKISTTKKYTLSNGENHSDNTGSGMIFLLFVLILTGFVIVQFSQRALNLDLISSARTMAQQYF